MTKRTFVKWGLVGLVFYCLTYVVLCVVVAKDGARNGQQVKIYAIYMEDGEWWCHVPVVVYYPLVVIHDAFSSRNGLCVIDVEKTFGETGEGPKLSSP